MAIRGSMIGFGALLAGLMITAPAHSLPVRESAEHQKAKSFNKPEPTLAYYSGERAGNGAYVALQSSNRSIWSSLKNDDGNLAPVIDLQRNWNIETNILKMGVETERAKAQAHADLDFGLRSAAAIASHFDAQMIALAGCLSVQQKCRPASVPKLKPLKKTIVAAKAVRLPPEPAASIQSIGDTNLDGLRKGFIRHVAGPKPSGWEEMVDAGREALNRGDEIAAMKVVNEYAKGSCGYYRRALDPQSKSRLGTPWFSEWTQTPYVAVQSDIGCDCRDNAAMTFYGLIAVGFPMDRVATALLLMSSSPKQGPATSDGDIVHVLTLVKTSQGKTVVLNQSEREGRSVFVVGDERFALGNKGLLSVGNLSGGRAFGPVDRIAPVLLASRSRWEQ